MSQIKKKFIENNAIDNTKLDQSSSYDFEANNGNVRVKTPIEREDAVNKEYVDGIINQVANSISNREVEYLTYTDTVNKVIALSHVPNNHGDVLLFSNEGTTQIYEQDFTISVRDDVAYLCLSSTSTSPSGAWDIQSLPTVGLTNLTGGEQFTVEYLYANDVVFSNTSTIYSVEVNTIDTATAILKKNVLNDITYNGSGTYTLPTMVDGEAIWVSAAFATQTFNSGSRLFILAGTTETTDSLTIEADETNTAFCLRAIRTNLIQGTR